MECGEDVEIFYRSWRENDRPPPELIGRPRALAHLTWVFAAFWSLAGDRGMDGSGPILFSAIDAYARRVGIDDAAEFSAFEGMIRAMDRVWLQHAAEERRRAERRRGKAEVDEDGKA